MTTPKEICVYKGMDDCLHTDNPEGDRTADAKIEYVLKSEVKELEGNINILELQIKAQDYWTDALAEKDKEIVQLEADIVFLKGEQHAEIERLRGQLKQFQGTIDANEAVRKALKGKDV